MFLNPLLISLLLFLVWEGEQSRQDETWEEKRSTQNGVPNCPGDDVLILNIGNGRMLGGGVAERTVSKPDEQPKWLCSFS